MAHANLNGQSSLVNSSEKERKHCLQARQAGGRGDGVFLGNSVRGWDERRGRGGRGRETGKVEGEGGGGRGREREGGWGRGRKMIAMMAE